MAFLKYLHKANTGGRGDPIKIMGHIGKHNLGI